MFAFFIVVFAGEGRFRVEEFVKKDAETPDVDLGGLVEVLDDFGRHVLDGAAEGMLCVFLVLGGPAEVADLGVALGVEENVFGLEVAVDYVSVVQVVDGQAHLVEEDEDLVLSQLLLPPEVAEQAALLGVLQDQRYVLLAKVNGNEQLCPRSSHTA